MCHYQSSKSGIRKRITISPVTPPLRRRMQTSMNFFNRVQGDTKKTAIYKSKERKSYASMPVFLANYIKPVKTLLLSFLFTLLLLIVVNNNNMIHVSVSKNERTATPLQQVKLVSSIHSKRDGVTVGDSTSVFNCGGSNGRCVYFYPTHFFNPEVGEGKKYRYILERLDELRKRKELWRNMPRIGFPTFSYNEQVMNTMTNETFHRHNVTFIHVHKAGAFPKKEGIFLQSFVLFIILVLLFLMSMIYFFLKHYYLRWHHYSQFCVQSSKDFSNWCYAPSSISVEARTKCYAWWTKSTRLFSFVHCGDVQNAPRSMGERRSRYVCLFERSS